MSAATKAKVLISQDTTQIIFGQSKLNNFSLILALTSVLGVVSFFTYQRAKKMSQKKGHMMKQSELKKSRKEKMIEDEEDTFVVDPTYEKVM